MSWRTCLINKNINISLKCRVPSLNSTREGHTLRGKRPGVARTLEQRLKDDNKVDPELIKQVNIGFAKLRPSRSEQLKERIAHVKAQRANSEIEKMARSQKLLINLDQVRADNENTSGQFHLKKIAEHFAIYQDLFKSGYFVPRIPLQIKYKTLEEAEIPVWNGNIIKPNEASKEPSIFFDGTMDPMTGKKSSQENLWTLVATNPDGHFSGEKKEYVHWFISNIPNGDVKKGELIVPYLQPFPPKGVGYQRFIFILYKQDCKLNFGEYQVSKPIDLEKRTFNTFEFYRKYQDKITPAGLAFCQTDWDKSLTEFYHKVLGIKEPIFEYDFPAPYLSDQKWFPLKQPFNLYMDKHRDQKQVHKEYLERKLAETHPFEAFKPQYRFPNAHPIKNTPSWLTTEIKKNRLKIGRINDV